MSATREDPNAARAVAEAARRRLHARLRGGGLALPPGSTTGSEAERLRAARAAIEALHRARGAERARGSIESGSRKPSAPPPVAQPTVAVPAREPARVHPRRRAPSPLERLAAPRRSGAATLALAGAATLAIGAAGFLVGRSTGAPTTVAAPVAPDTAAAAERTALVEDNLTLQRELAALETRAGALADLLAPASVAALAEADRELGLIELGSADPGADPADIERARRGVRDALERALGPAALETVREARGGAVRP